MRLRVATVLVGHEPKSYLDAHRKVEILMKELCPSAIRKTLIVDNSKPRVAYERISEDAVIIGGDNRYREFSGWDLGIAELERSRENPDLIHFVTSSFDSMYAGYLDAFNEEVLEAAYRLQSVVGHVDCYDQAIELLGRRSQSWLRTSFFFVPTEVVKRLRTVVSVECGEEIFAGNPDAPFRSGAPMSERYRDYIRSWLTGDGTGQGVVWHSRFDLSRETLPLFEAKVLAILNEHMLSVRMREAGYPICDVSWLRSRIDGSPGERLEVNTPWEDQIEARP